MRRGISRACGLFAVAVLCGHVGLLQAIAQQPQQTRQGIITTFAPVVEEPAQPEKTTVFGGVAVTNISDDIRTTLNLPKEIQGAVIADIDAESPAAKAGLREGDVIQEVNKQPVRSAKDLLAISKKLKPNEKILIRVYSQGQSGYVALDGG
jgi:S1-C subfamily serine protease